jgi:tetratricopeptide (TPR) repeat protein
VLLALAVATHHQIDYWQDNLTLWSHTLEITNANWLAENNYGAALLSAGRIDEAIDHFRTSEALYPGDPVSHLDIGYYEQQHGNFAVAFAEYDQVFRTAPKEKQSIAAEAHNNMGFAYLSMHDPGKAEENFQEAVALDPQHARAWLGLGVAQQKAGNISAAIRDYSNSIQVEPSDIAYLLLAQALELHHDHAGADRAVADAGKISHNFEQAQRVVNGFFKQ